MSYSKEELANYRIERAQEAIEEARLLAAENYWNTAVSRLYYACFYTCHERIGHFILETV